MRAYTKTFFIILIVSGFLFFGSTAIPQSRRSDRPEFRGGALLKRPLMERYILDELKDLRQDQQKLRGEMTEKMASNRLNAADRAISYATDTVNNIFFIITATGTLLVLMGWKSFADIRKRVEVLITERVAQVTKDYEYRLEQVEKKLKDRSEQILIAQEEIGQANQIHALWMRTGLATTPQEKIKLYDAILELNSEDVEAMTHKADTVLDMDEIEWALNLCNKAIEMDENYGYAYWQRACAYAHLNFIDEAINDLKTSIEKSPALKTEISSEVAFQSLKDHPDYEDLILEID